MKFARFYLRDVFWLTGILFLVCLLIYNDWRHARETADWATHESAWRLAVGGLPEAEMIATHKRKEAAYEDLVSRAKERE